MNFKKLVSLFFVVAITLSLFGCGDSEPSYIDLKAQVSKDAKYIHIQNEDDFVWDNAEISINEDYKYKVDFLAKGKSSLELIEFTKENGERFDSTKIAIKKIRIYVPKTEERKDGYWIGEFNN
jgi:uncharacterized lipoprotein YehR (DUF1307 family)